jgi:hypothetical protein
MSVNWISVRSGAVMPSQCVGDAVVTHNATALGVDGNDERTRMNTTTASRRCSHFRYEAEALLEHEPEAVV